jgi:amidase
MTLTALSAREQLAGLRRGDFSAVDLMQATLARIDAVNPKVNAIVSLRDADVLLEEARNPKSGPLSGLPMAIKDLAETKGLRTTHGSPIYADHVPKADDLMVARLRAAGAIIIGKTNTPEMGLGSHTYNPIFGATRNPYALDRSAGGSSGGAAVALACQMVALADGSDMMGSLRNPAAWNNVYGMRPTAGLVPKAAEGDTFSVLLSTSGPMARNPGDLGLLLSVMAEPNPEVPVRVASDDFQKLDPALKGKRIGWLADWSRAYPMERDVLDLCQSALLRMEQLGAKVEILPAPFPAEQLWDSWTTLRSFSIAMGERALWDDPAKRALLKPELQWEIERGLRFSAEDIHKASVIRSQWFANVARLFLRFDALALPSAQCLPFPIDWTWPHDIAGRSMDTYHRWMEVVVPVSLAGLPAVAIPAGFVNGLPMGLQLFGRRGADNALLNLAEAWHQATDWPSKLPPASQH